MMSDDTCDARLEELRRLQVLAPDPQRAARVRMRCRAQFGRRQKRQARRELIAGFALRTLAPVVVGGFCVIYIFSLVTTTLRLRGVFE
jgi:hypothetical protein